MNLKKCYKNLAGNNIIGYIICFSKNYIFIYIGYPKMVVIFNILNILENKKQKSYLYFRLENKKIKEIRQNLKDHKLINHQIYFGYFGLLSLGKIYRLNKCFSINFNRNLSKLQKLKILGKKYEIELALGINGFFWFKHIHPLNILIFLSKIFLLY